MNRNVIQAEFLKILDTYEKRIRPGSSELDVPLEITVSLDRVLYIHDFMHMKWFKPTGSGAWIPEFQARYVAKIIIWNSWKFVNSISRLNQVDMRYEMGVFLRQEWKDKRLDFRPVFTDRSFHGPFIFIPLNAFAREKHFENRLQSSEPSNYWSYNIRLNSYQSVMDSWFMVHAFDGRTKT